MECERKRRVKDDSNISGLRKLGLKVLLAKVRILRRTLRWRSSLWMLLCSALGKVCFLNLPTDSDLPIFCPYLSFGLN